MVEGGAPGFALFVAIMGLIFFALCRYNSYIAASFAAIGTMNLFLHSYESVYLSLLLFSLAALVIAHGQSTYLRK